jgi:hypothetical protein
LVRLGFDWIDAVVSDHDFSLNERVRPAYLAAYSVLNNTHLERMTICRQQTHEATNEEEYADAHGDCMDEEYRWDEQTQALATMALTLTACANKSFLDQMKKLFVEAHPPDSKPYSGRSQLHRQISEYKARFGVDLEKITAFETIREVELARHCCVHDEGRLSADYCKQTRQRLVGKHGYIDITPELLATFLSEIDQFSRGLSSEMKTVRSAHRALTKGGIEK